MQIKHSAELREATVQRRREGASVRELSRTTGVPMSTIRWWIGDRSRSTQVKSTRTDRRPIDDQVRDDIIRRINTGEQARAVAKMYGLHERTVARIWRRGHAVHVVRPKREWVDDARCRNDEPGLFFPSDTLHYARDVADAKTICNRCPVIDDCLAWAIDRSEHGIWGGTTDDERREMRRTA